MIATLEPDLELIDATEPSGSFAAATARELAEVAELVEAYSMEEMTRAMPSDALAAYGVRLGRIGAAVAQAAAIDVPFLNRIVGLGLREPVTEATLDAVEALYRGAKVRYMLQLNPAVLTPELEGRLERRGLQRMDNWIQLIRGVEPPPDVRSELRVEQVGAEYAEPLAQITCDAFEMPREYGPFLTGLVGQPSWRHYAAFDGALPVATGALFVRGLVGYLTFGATDAAHRRRGAQGAIMARRIRDAAVLGCRWLVTTAMEETPEHPNPSYHNMLRAGFRPAYARPNYISFPE